MIRKAFATDYPNTNLQSQADTQAASVSDPIRRTLGHSVDLVARLNLSIRAKILISLCIVILLMGAINALLVLQVLNVSRQYDAIITNVATANSISSIKTDIDSEMWKIVAGKIEFQQGKQYEIINDVNSKLVRMHENTDSPRARVKLDVILRSMQTLGEKVDRMGEQIALKSTATANEALLEDIRFHSSVVQEVVQDYVLYEVQRTERQYQEMRDGLARWFLSFVILTIVAVGFAVIATWGISRSIYIPIQKLHDVTTTLTKNDLQALMNRDNRDEITELGMSFNIMIGKIRELLDSKIQEQENLKKAELRALQAQINPHFLYNTLDTIIWMAESNKTNEVVTIVSALSNFFRISLSKGKDWITIGEELERTRSYLTIQRMRYRDIMDFSIEADESILQHTVLKLVLQPLVENALYHGIKNRRQRGMITIRAEPRGANLVQLTVRDDGIGIPPDKLAEINTALGEDAGELSADHGFGLANVNRRIELYYGTRYGVDVQSDGQTGTLVTIVIPLTPRDETMGEPVSLAVPLPMAT